MIKRWWERRTETTKCWIVMLPLLSSMFFVCYLVVYYIFLPIAGINPGDFR